MDFDSVAAGVCAYAHHMSCLVSVDLASWQCPERVCLFCYINDVMLTSDSLADLEDVAPLSRQHLAACGWAVSKSKVQGPGLSARLFGVIWSEPHLSAGCFLPGNKITSIRQSTSSHLAFINSYIFITALRLKYHLTLKEASFYDYNVSICCYLRIAEFLKDRDHGLLPSCLYIFNTSGLNGWVIHMNEMAQLPLVLSEFARPEWALCDSSMAPVDAGGWIHLQEIPGNRVPMLEMSQ
ncbi:uncharacterized protein LOC108593770 [Callithrix jacchus]|uniref:uncharacterized protein LOC108593770 n=1 Tax=Callithrix jacchus TaxID=9483 RepID=UPI00083F8A60|nr:uncharacterized protein LOC108593770 [Callithrix jacchus]